MCIMHDHADHLQINQTPVVVFTPCFANGTPRLTWWSCHQHFDVTLKIIAIYEVDVTSFVQMHGLCTCSQMLPP